MNSIMDINLPDELLAFKENIEATIKPFIEIKATPENNLELWQSKFGGFPFLPKGSQHPKDAKGQVMSLLAQINFAEAPKLASFPEKGILQFYISSGSDLHGVGFGELTKQDDFKVLYFPDVIEDENQLVTDFSFLPKTDSSPLERPCSLAFHVRHAPLPTVDHHFESRILGKNRPASQDALHKIYEEYDKLFTSEGHKLGGYPYFTQNDPRQSEEYKGKIYVLLFQMDSDYDAGIMWGDSGVANFFILEQDLRKRDFSRVLYNWDCC